MSAGNAVCRPKGWDESPEHAWLLQGKGRAGRADKELRALCWETAPSSCWILPLFLTNRCFLCCHQCLREGDAALSRCSFHRGMLGLRDLRWFAPGRGCSDMARAVGLAQKMPLLGFRGHGAIKALCKPPFELPPATPAKPLVKGLITAFSLLAPGYRLRGHLRWPSSRKVPPADPIAPNLPGFTPLFRTERNRALFFPLHLPAGAPLRWMLPRMLPGPIHAPSPGWQQGWLRAEGTWETLPCP